MHMWHHVTNHLIITNDKDFNSENQIKLRVRDSLHKAVTLLHRLIDWAKHLAAHTLPAIGHGIGMALLVTRGITLQRTCGSSMLRMVQTDMNVCYASKKLFKPP
jgi:hypothetical protein